MAKFNAPLSGRSVIPEQSNPMLQQLLEEQEALRLQREQAQVGVPATPQATQGIPVYEPESYEGSMAQVPARNYAVDNGAFRSRRVDAQAYVEPNNYRQSSSNVGYSEPGIVDDINRGQVTGKLLDTGVLQPDYLDKRGEPVTPEMYQQQQALELQRQKKASALPYAYETEQQLQQAWPKSMHQTNSGKMHDVARSIGESMANTPIKIDKTATGATTPLKTSSMTYVQQAFNLNPIEVSNLATQAISLVAPVIMGGSEVVDGVITNPELNDMLAFMSSVDDDTGGTTPISVTATSGTVPKETVISMLGSAFHKLFQHNNTDAQGRPLEKKQAYISPKETGSILYKALIDQGFLQENHIDGQATVAIHPAKGVSSYRAMKDFSREIGDKGRGRSQMVPVTSTGMPFGAQANIRRLTPTNKVNYTDVGAITEAKRIFGSVGILISPIKSFFSALFTSQAINEAFEGDTPRQFDKMHPHPRQRVSKSVEGLTSTVELMGITGTNDKNASEESKRSNQKALLTQANVLLKLLNYNGQNITDGVPRYAPHWEDYTVHRFYNDTEDVNLGRDLQTRAVAGFIAVAMDISKTTYHAVPITKQQSVDIYNRIGERARASNFELSPAEMEHGWITSLGYALDAGRTVNMATNTIHPSEMASIVTPDFIYKAADIGKVLASIPPTKTSAIAAISMDPTQLKTNLTAVQLTVLNDFIHGSTKKDWGYRLQSYLDAYNYVTAKEAGLPFTPRALAEMDENSAGRTFLAYDTGDLDVLKRTGIMYGDSRTDSGLTNTMPRGNPRYHFMGLMLDVAIDKAFSKDDEAKAHAWATALGSVREDTNFADKAWKPPLLQTDYGVPVMYHAGSAKRILRKNPWLVFRLAEVYGDDQVAMVRDLQMLIGFTLKEATSEWQQRLPKDMASILAMVGEGFSPEGFFKEHMSFGYMGEQDLHTSTIVGEGEDALVVNHTKPVLDLNKAGKPKLVETAEGTDTFTPGPATAVRNQVGPATGQYRESVFLILIANYLNGGKLPTKMIPIQGVHDNIIIPATHMPMIHYIANNVLLEKVLEWNLPKAFVADFNKKWKHAMNVVIPNETEIDLGDGSKYAPALSFIDRQYKFAKQAQLSGKYMSDQSKELLTYLESPSSGYNPEIARGRLVITPAQFTKWIKLTMNNKLFYKEGKATHFLPDMWEKRANDSIRDNLAEIKSRARKGKVNFMSPS